MTACGAGIRGTALSSRRSGEPFCFCCKGHSQPSCPGLVPGIHVLPARMLKDVDGREKPGHDELGSAIPSLCGLCVILDRRTRAHQIAVAIDIVDASDRTPVFVDA